jgi:hypothetical protein
MSDLSKDLEALAGDMGFNISDSPENTQPEEQVQTQEENVQQEVQQSEPQEQVNTQSEPAVEEAQSSLNETESVVALDDSAVLSYLSEKLGKELKGFEDLASDTNTSAEIDERVAAINEFVKSTGRDPKDWFSYQSMNPSEMDDTTVVLNQLKNQYPDLSNEDISLLIEDKYRLDEDLYDESEIRLAKIQLKIDADKGRQELESVREKYAAPNKVEETQQPQEEYESIIDDNWLNNMSAEVDALEGIEFEVAKDKSFTFGIEDNYKSQLKSKNEKIEDFFAGYADNDGNWDFEKWNMHQAVLDNIETIVKTAYQQGLGEGQRGLVDKAANVQYQQPNETNNVGGQNVPSIEEQVKQALGMNDNGLTFKI